MGGENAYPTGPARQLQVFPGHVIDMEVWAYYEGTSGWGSTNTAMAAFITNVAAGFGGSPTGSPEAQAIYNGVDAAYGTFGMAGNQGDATPSAYLNYILFDKNYKLLNMGWTAVPGSANGTQQKMTISSVKVTEPGYIFVHLSYEAESDQWVYFDDFKVTHHKTKVLQYNEYYPFGLQTSTSWTREGHSNNFLYNSGSELNPNAGWYETFFRGYDAALGRFLQVDPLAHQFAGLSPYQYAYNNPVLFNDPLGDEPGVPPGHVNDNLDRILDMVEDAWNSTPNGSTGHFTYENGNLTSWYIEATIYVEDPAGGGGLNITYRTNPNGSYTATVRVAGSKGGPIHRGYYFPEVIITPGDEAQGSSGLWNAFAEGAANAKSDMIMPSGAMAGWAGMADLTNLAVRHDANHYTKFSNLRKVAQASKYVKMAGTTLGVAGVIVSGIESGLDENGFTWGDAAKLGVGAGVTALAILGSPVLATGAVIYGVVDLGFGLFTEASLSDRLGAGIDNMIK